MDGLLDGITNNYNYFLLILGNFENKNGLLVNISFLTILILLYLLKKNFKKFKKVRVVMLLQSNCYSKIIFY